MLCRFLLCLLALSCTVQSASRMTAQLSRLRLPSVKLPINPVSRLGVNPRVHQPKTPSFTYLKVSPYSTCNSGSGSKALLESERLGFDQKDMISGAPDNFGLNGVYLLEYPDGSKSIFKPSVFEETTMQDMGFPAGMYYLNERAAYLLDQSLDLQAGVPPTRISNHVQGIGSEQEFIYPTCPLKSFIEKTGVLSFTKAFKVLSRVPLRQLQALALLDIAIFNVDRHFNNLLISSPMNKPKAVPIDHGRSFVDFRYISKWPLNPCYRGAPFVNNALLPELRDQVVSMDIAAALRMLLENGLRPTGVLTAFVHLELLKDFARKDYTLYEMLRHISAIHTNTAFRTEWTSHVLSDPTGIFHSDQLDSLSPGAEVDTPEASERFLEILSDSHQYSEFTHDFLSRVLSQPK